jgi:hypothetical protein
MIFEMRFQILALAASLAVSTLAGYAVSETPTASPANPERFAAVSDARQWSATIFTEFGNEKAWEDQAPADHCGPPSEQLHHGNGLLEGLSHRISQSNFKGNLEGLNGAPGKTSCPAP